MSKSVKLWTAMTPRKVIGERVADVLESLQEAMNDIERLTSYSGDDITEFTIEDAELAAPSTGVELRVWPNGAKWDNGYVSVPLSEIGFFEFIGGGDVDLIEGSDEDVKWLKEIVVLCDRYLDGINGLRGRVEAQRKLAEQALKKL